MSIPKPDPIPLSVCLIAGNEARRIGRALASVKDFAREVVVLLNEDVADGTDQIVAAAGGRVYREPWKGFGPQKQSVTEKCTQPWILNLDADEAVTPELQAEIRELVARSGPADHGPAAYSCPRRSFYCGRWITHGEWYPDRQIRLWRRGRARWPAAIIHEKLEAAGPIGRLQGDLLHYSHESINHDLGKIITFSDVFLQQRADYRVTWRDLAFRPAWRFFRGYVLRRGFLDGWQGYYIACVCAFSAATRYAKLREVQGRSRENG